MNEEGLKYSDLDDDPYIQEEAIFAKVLDKYLPKIVKDLRKEEALIDDEQVSKFRQFALELMVSEFGSE